MEELWGLSLNHTIILVALLLIIIDMFFSSDVLTVVGYVVLSSLVWTNLEQHVLLKLIFSIIAFALCIAFHYLLWRKVLKRGVDLIAPTRYEDSPTKHLGQKGVVRVIDQKVMIELTNGELWPCKRELGDLQDGLSVEVESIDEGYVQIRTI